MIESVVASLRVLNLIAHQPHLGLTEISRQLDLNKSRTFRILSTLKAMGYVQQSREDTYHLGVLAWKLGQSAQAQFHDWIKISEPVLEDLAAQFDENLQIRVRQGWEMVQVYSRRSQQTLQVVSTVGNRRPLGSGAAGKILLAFMNEAEIMDLPEAYQHLYAELEPIRQSALACSRGELTLDVGAIAVPLFDAMGQCVASLSASVPLSRLTESYQSALSEALLRAAGRISQLLGAMESERLKEH
ncbi:MAG: IclR family transcriptional regulator [Cardiobacteriaceae bacterium]|nr:IclR family transcriptional regulator [Cardiobacteriaceae bacterium]